MPYGIINIEYYITWAYIIIMGLFGIKSTKLIHIINVVSKW